VTIPVALPTPREGETITASYAGNGAGTASWQWLADDTVISGAAGSTYVPRVADVGRTIRARVSFTNQTGSITSNPTSAVARPVLTGSVTLSTTTPREGETVTASFAGNGSGAATWQWLANETVISGATSSTFTVRASDIGRTLRARVTFANQIGTVTSAASSTVTRPALTGNVTLSTATPTVGDTIIADYIGNGTGMARWQWLADDSPIRGATNNTYVVRAADAGRRLRAQVTYSNQIGNVSSNPTSEVARP
jgi:hypothetical protein